MSDRRAPTPDVGDLTAVVPARNAAHLLPACLESLRESGVAEIIVVDGLSTDRSRDVARAWGATVLSDGGGGLPLARSLGVREAGTRWVALVDADVVVPSGALRSLLEEFVAGDYAGLQAGLASVSGPGYWGQALVHHHRTGRSRWWFGVVATIFERERLLATGFDRAFSSGEDIELRWRFEQAGLKTGVSRQVEVQHRFGADDFEFAKDQFLMDGTGLGLMIRKHGVRGLPLAVLPLAAAARGAMLSVVRREPRWLRYFAAFAWFNYAGMRRGLAR